jgi:hypothetical protein
MPPVGFEPTILISERPQTHDLDRAATGIGNGNLRGRKEHKLHMFAVITDAVTQSVLFRLAYFRAFCLFWHKKDSILLWCHSGKYAEEYMLHWFKILSTLKSYNSHLRKCSFCVNNKIRNWLWQCLKDSSFFVEWMDLNRLPSVEFAVYGTN